MSDILNDAMLFEEKINRYIRERKRLDLQVVYEQLCDQYSLVLTNTGSLENGIEDYGADFMILCGESSAGKFQLYDDGLYIVFDVDKADGIYTHWHPSDLTEVIGDIKSFMQGKCKY